ncbi:hypothetical protein J4402_03820 [Candidatus Pacearchaeota archaeon]|nr:hypothetical protein [Candidatus Pacearchaeota archaeon]
MNRKAIELAISTLVILVLGILVLIGLIYFITDGFKTFKSSTKPFLDTTQSSSIKAGCQLACDNADRLTFCCEKYPIQKEEIKCTDSRLGIQCDLTCADTSCLAD